MNSARTAHMEASSDVAPSWTPPLVLPRLTVYAETLCERLGGGPRLAQPRAADTRLVAEAGASTLVLGAERRTTDTGLGGPVWVALVSLAAYSRGHCLDASRL
jgi:hypothetical protein